MRRSSSICLLYTALLAAAFPVAHAQDVKALQRENARLRGELEAAKAAPVGGQAGEQRTGDLAFGVSSLRVGAATGYARGHVAVTVTLGIRNAGARPLRLNYNQRSFGLTDDHGYQYTLYHEHSSTYYADDVKGIPMATNSRASTDVVLAPGQTQKVTFIATRHMRDGQTPGNSFDLNATFGDYDDLGQGRIRKVRDYPVAFIGLAPSGATGRNAGDTARSLLNRVLGR